MHGDGLMTGPYTRAEKERRDGKSDFRGWIFSQRTACRRATCRCRNELPLTRRAIGVVSDAARRPLLQGEGGFSEIFHRRRSAVKWRTMGIILMAVLYANTTAAAGNGDRYVGAPFATRAPVIAQHGMAATMQPLASQIAIDVLKRGGTAMDAAIAANAALGLMEPVSCGVGGDLFAIIWDPKTKHLYGYNGSGRSPKGRSLADMLRKLEGQPWVPAFGSLSVTVPGAVDGWYALHDKFGRVPMPELLAPAIAY